VHAIAGDLATFGYGQINDRDVRGLLSPLIQPLVEMLQMIPQRSRTQGIFVSNLKRASEMRRALTSNFSALLILDARRPKDA
jgi:hypothetical protein